MPAWLRLTLLAATALGIYLLLAGSVSATEVVAGIGVSAATTAFVASQRARQDRRLDFPPLFHPALKAVGELATETPKVGLYFLQAIMRPALSTLRAQPLPEPATAGLRAREALITSIAPATIVLDLTPSAIPASVGGMLVHHLRAEPAHPV